MEVPVIPENHGNGALPTNGVSAISIEEARRKGAGHWVLLQVTEFDDLERPRMGVVIAESGTRGGISSAFVKASTKKKHLYILRGRPRSQLPFLGGAFGFTEQELEPS